MGKMDLYADTDEFTSRGGSQGASGDTEGVSARELIDVASAGGLVALYVRKVLEAAGLQALSNDWGAEKVTRDVHLLERFMARAIKVTKAREALSGSLMEQAQKQIQIIRNERTKTEALLMSEGLLENLLEVQANEMATQIVRMKDKIREQEEAQSAALSRQSFLDMRKTMPTIKAKVPILEGAKTAADVPL